MEIAKSNGVKYFDFQETDFHDTLFYDNCHLKPDGESLKAKIIFNNIKNLIK